MTEKEQILKQVSDAMDNTQYGQIRIELRGNTSPIDVVVEERKRYTRTLPKRDYKQG